MITVRFTAAVLGGLVTIAFSGGATAVAASGPSLTVQVAGLPDQTLTSTQINADSEELNLQYATRSNADTLADPSNPRVPTGLTVARALASLPHPVELTGDGFIEVTVPGDMPPWSTLTAPDITAAPDFFGDLPPVFQLNGDTLDYFRPLRDDPSDPDGTDVNIHDFRSTTPDGEMELIVHTGPQLAVTATASPTALQRGQSVAFSANAANPGHQLTYTWDFGDGMRGHGASVLHSFAADGTYQAMVTVSGDDDSAGASGLITIQVGNPPATTASSPGAGGSGASASPTAPTVGPVVSSGGTRIGAAVADKPSRSPTVTHREATRVQHSPASARAASRLPREPRSPTRSPTVGRAAIAPARRNGEAQPRPRTGHADAGLVHGQIIDAQLARALITSPSTDPAPATAPAAAAPSRNDVRGSAAIVAVLLALFGVGIMRERRPGPSRLHGLEGSA